MSQGTYYLLSNLGTPAAPTAEAVGAYLKEFLTDPFVIPLPAPLRHLLVRGIIVPRRAPESAEKYASIWTEEGSPLLRHSRALLHEVRAHLGDTVLLGMRYGSPSLASALREAREAGAERIVLAPLYPQHARASTGSTENHFRALCRAQGFRGETAVLPPFPSESFFIRPLAASITPALTSGAHLLLTFHGVPEGQRGNGPLDYRAQCEQTAQAVARELGLPQESWSLSFQSRFGRGRWIRPYTEDLLHELPRRGVKRLVVAAPSFVADCLETIEEIGLRGRESFLASGGEHYELVPALNADPAFAQGLASALAAV